MPRDDNSPLSESIYIKSTGARGRGTTEQSAAALEKDANYEHLTEGIITGASQGIGDGLVWAYRDRGYRVVATSRTIKQGSDAGVHAVAGDISNPETAERVLREALDRFSRIDTLVNNAGVFLAKPFIEFTQQDFDHNFAVNVEGFFHVTQRVA